MTTNTLLHLIKSTKMSDGKNTLYFPKGRFNVHNKRLHPVDKEYQSTVRVQHIEVEDEESNSVETDIVENLEEENE